MTNCVSAGRSRMEFFAFSFSRVLLVIAAAAALLACGGGGGGGGGAASANGPSTDSGSRASYTFDDNQGQDATMDFVASPATPAPLFGDGDSSGSLAAADLGRSFSEPAPTPTPTLLSFAAAHRVIGQPDMVSGGANQGGTPGLNTLKSPQGAVARGPQGQWVVPDFANNRVLVFSGVPDVNGQSAMFQLPASGPSHVAVHGEHLVVVEYFAHRVAIYRVFPRDADARPDVFVDQPGPDSTAPAGGASGLFHPYGAALTPQGQLLVADAHHRVLIWRALPQQHGRPADLVLGRPDFGPAAVAAPSARTLNLPSGVWSDGQRIVVTDSHNHRLLVWTKMPDTSYQPADLVLGQVDFAGGKPNDSDGDYAQDAAPSGSSLHMPWGAVAFDGVRMAVSDSANHRVLIWDSFPRKNGQPADRVLGQSGFDRSTPNANPSGSRRVNAHGLHYPAGVQWLDGRLAVPDHANNRLLIFAPK